MFYTTLILLQYTIFNIHISKQIWNLQFVRISVKINFEKNNEIIRNLLRQVFNPVKIVRFGLFVLIRTRSGDSVI